jgi:uncharacterized protein (DUF4415 family)
MAKSPARPPQRPPLRPPMRAPLRPLTDEEGEVRELTDEDFASMDLRPVAEVFPELPEAMKRIRPVGRPRVAAPKEQISFRLPADFVADIKATGPGYNVRVENALRKAFTRREVEKA